MKSLKTKMVFAFAVPIALLLLGLSFVLTTQIKNTILPLTEEMSSEIVHNRTAQINDRLLEYVREAKFVSDSFFAGFAVDVASLEQGRLTHYQALIKSDIANRKRSLREGIYDVFFIDTLGNRYEGDGTTMSYGGDSPYYRAILHEDQQFFVGTPYLNDKGKLVIDVVHEVINDEGSKVGLLGIQAPFSELATFAQQSKVGSAGYGWLVDNRGQILTYPDQALNGINLENAATLGYQGFQLIKNKIAVGEGGAATVTLPTGEKMLVFFEPTSGAAKWTLAISVPLEVVLGRAGKLRLFTFVAFALLIMLSFLVALTMADNVVKPVQLIARGLQQISEGELDCNMSFTRQDEIGKMAESFNEMAKTLQTIVLGIISATEAISSETIALTGISEENSLALSQVAATVAEFSATADESSRHAEEMSGKAQNALSFADQGLEKIALSGEIMSAIDRTAKQSVLAIQALQSETSQIGQMLDSISDIAEQTNLLALNAAIEAARAGDEGRGFAVVAQEVRKLAEQTQALVTQVRSVMVAVSKQAEDAVNTASINEQEVERGTEVLEATSQAFALIAANVQEIVASFSEVAQATQELATGSEEIAAATGQQMDSIERMGRMIITVGQVVDELKVLVAGFQMEK